MSSDATEQTGERAPLPFVLVNMAMTADGKIATGNRVVSSFGSQRDFEHLLELRATADAVLCGARTAAAADVNLGPGPARFRQLRLKAGLAEFNLRVVASGAGRIGLDSELFRHRFSPIIVLTTSRADKTKLRSLRRVADDVKICGVDGIDFRRAFHWLRKKWNVKRLLCEGGGELNAALFRADLIHELHLTICPKIFGGRRAPTIAEGVSASRLANASQCQIQSIERVGGELFVVCRVIPREQNRMRHCA
jgi:riboflavin-specific deaminase-like protein